MRIDTLLSTCDQELVGEFRATPSWLSSPLKDGGLGRVVMVMTLKGLYPPSYSCREGTSGLELL